MQAPQFAIATANLACKNAFLFLVTHCPIFIAPSSASTLLQCGFQYCRWSCSPHATRCGFVPHYNPGTIVGRTYSVLLSTPTLHTDETVHDDAEMREEQ